MPQAELMKQRDSDCIFVYLKRQVEMDVIVKIEKLGIDGIGSRKEYKRYHPQGAVMAHITLEHILPHYDDESAMISIAQAARDELAASFEQDRIGLAGTPSATC